MLLAPLRDARAELTEIDQRLLEARHKFPADSFVVMEMKLLEGDSATPKICRTMGATMKNELGQTLGLLTQDLYLFDRANNIFGGSAVLSPHTYFLVAAFRLRYSPRTES